MPKQRLTVTLDARLVDAVKAAVKGGRIESVSALVAASLEQMLAEEERLRALAAYVADYEAEFGEITDEEMADQRRRDRDAAAAVRAGMREAG